ncbi:class I SAM-dependent methyltransferase, partial [Holdemanella biformis]
MIPCSNRIQEILEWVNGDCIADIGCDHAYVVCNAILNHQSKKGYACDVAQGPLDNAKKTIEDNELSDFVSCRLLDGIQGLNEDVDQIIICGMGAKLIIDILSKGNLHSGLRFLLSSHKDDFILREYLRDHNIHIVREKMIYDNGHYYPILDCVVKDHIQDISTSQLHFGMNMKMDSTYLSYLDFEENKY